MATARRSRLIDAPPQAIWEVVADPHHYPRWWPGVDRVEGVSADHFTEVHTTKKGRAMRMDFRVVSSEPPHEGRPASMLFEQDLPGTPWERFLTEATTEIVLEPKGTGTEVTIGQRQKLRGYSRAGGTFFFRRAMAHRLDEALAGLDRAVG